MQKDFMSMAQGQAAPAPQGGMNVSQEELASGLNEAGLPTEQTPEAAKQRLMAMLEELGITKNLRTDQLQQLTQLVDEYVKIAMQGDMAALEKHPISQLLNQAAQQLNQQGTPQTQAAPQQAAPQQAAPTDFASMMPPGGGMGGR